MTDTSLEADSIEYVKTNKSIFIDYALKSANKSKQPVAVFMAGTPGAGKTEIARSIMALFDTEPCRIDADEFRDLIPGYTGDNSHEVQRAASLAVDKVLDVILEKKYSFILDGTFAIGKSIVNIKRALRKGYEAQIYFIYQDPEEAWLFTKIREQKEGRYVPKETFINAYYESRKNVIAVKEEFGDAVVLRVIVKSYKDSTQRVYDNVTDLAKVLPELYNETKLGELLHD